MDELALLKPKLTRLKLSGMLDTLTERLQPGAHGEVELHSVSRHPAHRRSGAARLQAARAPAHQERPGAGQDPGDLRLLVQSEDPCADAARTGHLPLRAAGRECLFRGSIRRRQESRSSGARSHRLSQGIRGHLRTHQCVARLDPRRPRRCHLPAPGCTRSEP